MKNNEISKLWNKNFFLLWQGSLVSFIGDMLYQFALGFWVLDKTGSTATMSLVMAAGFVPQILVGIFAGTYVDRHDRKRIIVFTDLIRGISVLVGGILALLNLLPIWGVMIISIIIGTCSSFFYPASGSSIPDIVPSDSLDRANSLNSMIQGGGKIIGKAMAGFLFTILGAPILFIANGVSYLLSALSESFISIPQVHKENNQKKFQEDLKEGAKYLWEHKVLRYFIIVAALQNFTFVVAEVLFLPFFKEQLWLGPEKFGIFQAVSASGGLLAMIILVFYTIPQTKRASIFIFSFIFQSLLMALVPLFGGFYLMLIFMFLSLFINALVNVMLRSFLQKVIPFGMRGKVLGFIGVLLTSFIPIGLSLGGILGEIFPVKYVIFCSLMLGSILGVSLIFSQEVKEFLKSN
ncbi:MAG: MFS transporter [Spirochaetaceae bacterium]